MIGNLVQKGTARFPQIRIAVLSGRTVELIKTRRTLYASVAGVALVGVAVSAGGVLLYKRNVADQQIAAQQIEAANIDLQDQLAKLRDQMAASSRDLAAAQTRVASLSDEVRAHNQAPQPQPLAEAGAPAKGEKASQLSQQLHVAEAQRATLAARLSKAEADLAEQQARQAGLLGQLDQWQKKFEQLSSDRDRLKARVGVLEKQSALRHAQQQLAQAASATAASAPVSGNEAPAATASGTPPAPQQRVAGILGAPPAAAPAVAAAAAPAAAVTAQPPAAAAAQPPAVAAPPPGTVAAAAAAGAAATVNHGAVDHFARVLASAGVDVRHLFAQFGVNRGEGGPFIPVSRGQPVDTALSAEKIAALRAMVKAVPVAAPLESYEISSPFGVRGDPENGHAGFHTGIDLIAPYDTPVYATAPGVVTYAGTRDDYGKIVEIDHGNGIATRYAHLHAFTVSVGQRLAAHAQVGYLGSTGRATGPHVHYEVVVNGEPQDPEKFFGLARYIPSLTVPVAARSN
ncbi:MAG: peptidoglycan DD-metalloendopeptidase family protein [Alphaproteobacteria bacterium]|nr:peptidoglycan DD-metalloendopeptidase family protein [Alphaproteobacteria bacterium]MBV9554332.1 peptidoglycan DD-metalloendopeptidase family protein [Alphaproteobacteria bacterium]